MAVSVSLMVLLPVLLAGLLSAPEAAASTPPACYKYGVPGCPRDYHPVCGTDGETYSNECVLCLSNRYGAPGEPHEHQENCRKSCCG